MSVQLNSWPKNEEAKEYYRSFNPEMAKDDDTLILLDLYADGDFQQLGAVRLTKELIQKGLPKSVKKVLLIVSDIWIEAEAQRLNAIQSFAKEIENLGVKLSVSHANGLSIPTTPAK